MKCNLYATFRLLVGERSVEVDLPEGATIQQAVQAMVECRPVLRTHWLNEEGELKPHVHIFVNGEDLQTFEQGLQTPLPSNATLDFFPPIGGGMLDS